MWIKAEDLVSILKKLDEVEESARVAASTYERENWQQTIRQLQELRVTVYEGLLKEEQERPAPIVYPVVAPQQWETHSITCKD